MSRPYLPDDFVLQRLVDKASVEAVVAIDAGRGVAISLAPSGPAPVHTTVRVAGLLAKRFYRIEGGGRRFVRTDEQGTAAIPLTVTDGTILALWPVV